MPAVDRTALADGDDGRIYNDGACAKLEDEEGSAIPKPGHRAACEKPACDLYRWSYSEWSQCSTDCGPGIQTRSVACVRVNDRCAEADIRRQNSSDWSIDDRSLIECYRPANGSECSGLGIVPEAAIHCSKKDCDLGINCNAICDTSGGFWVQNNETGIGGSSMVMDASKSRGGSVPWKVMDSKKIFKAYSEGWTPGDGRESAWIDFDLKSNVTVDRIRLWAPLVNNANGIKQFELFQSSGVTFKASGGTFQHQWTFVGAFFSKETSSMQTFLVENQTMIPTRYYRVNIVSTYGSHPIIAEIEFHVAPEKATTTEVTMAPIPSTACGDAQPELALESSGIISRKTYAPLSRCSWRIDAQTSQNRSQIELVFDYFFVEEGWDFVYVFDGLDAATSVRNWTLSGSFMPQPIVALSGHVLILLVSDASTNALGFQVRYTVLADDVTFSPTALPSISTAPPSFSLGYLRQQCNCSYYFTDAPIATSAPSSYVGSCGNSASGSLVNLYGPNGTITDGGSKSLTPGLMKNEYMPLAKCDWIVHGQGGKIELRFTKFFVEKDYDWLKIYDGNSSASPLIVWASGIAYPREGLVATSGTALVSFRSDDSKQAPGFRVEYRLLPTLAPSLVPTRLPTPLTAAPSYPGVCNGTSLMTNRSGVVTDGIRDYWRADSLPLRNATNTDRWTDFMKRGAALHYPPNLHCTWQISVDGPVRLIFETFWLEKGFDFLKVYDGSAPNGKPLATLTGAILPGMLTASSGNMFLLMTSDASIEGPGFFATYSVVGGAGSAAPTTSPTSAAPTQAIVGPCNGTSVVRLQASPVVIGDGPGLYPTNQYCQWRITADVPDAHVSLQLTHLSTEFGFDFVVVYDEPELQTDGGWNCSRGVQLARWSGQAMCTYDPNARDKCAYAALPAAVLSTSGRMCVVWSTDFISQQSGFEARLQRIIQTRAPRSAPPTSLPTVDCRTPTAQPSGRGCGGASTLYSAIGVISDGYSQVDSTYAPNMDCQWQIFATGPIALNFSYFELERSFDTVRVYDGSSIVDCASLGANERRASCSRLLEQLSGAALPRTLVASSGAMLITFRSDGSVQQRGFLATYSSLTATTPSPARRRVPSPAPLRWPTALTPAPSGLPVRLGNQSANVLQLGVGLRPNDTLAPSAASPAPVVWIFTAAPTSSPVNPCRARFGSVLPRSLLSHARACMLALSATSCLWH